MSRTTQPKKVLIASVASRTDGPLSALRFPAWLMGFRLQAICIALLALVFYGNTSQNEYALDDAVVIIRNEYVLKGIKGIPDIMTKDAYDSYYRQLGTSNELYAGRYRPLSIATFALEQELFGAIPDDKIDSAIGLGLAYDPENPKKEKLNHELHIRHVFNVIWFALGAIVLLYFLRYIVFTADPVIAFIAAILFTIHPVHTEVVANIKSRDEILSLLFICLTFIFAFKHREHKKVWWLLLALSSYLLALLSKEYGVAMIGLLPVAFYILGGDSIKKSVLSTLPYLLPLALYFLLRLPLMNDTHAIASQDIQINPYAFATAEQTLATKIATPLNYIRLLVFPHPLTSDYSYDHIPYKTFSHPLVWISLVVHLGLVLLLAYWLRKRNVLAFGLAFFLFHLAMVANLLVDIGATMSERLIYHSSVGFVIMAAYLLVKAAENLKPATNALPVLGTSLLVITVCCGYKTIQRNADWKNDETLYFQDIGISKNSFLINTNVASLLVNKSDFEKDEAKRLEQLHTGVRLLNKVLDMQHNYVLGYMNRAVAYLKLNEPDSLSSTLDIIRTLYPIHPQLPEMYFYAGDIYARNNKFDNAVASFKTALTLNPNFVPAQQSLREVDSLQRIIKSGTQQK